MGNKTSAGHYDAAEKLLEEAETHQTPDTTAEWCLKLADMHLALSQAKNAPNRVKAPYSTKTDLSEPGPRGPKGTRPKGPTHPSSGLFGKQIPLAPEKNAKTTDDDGPS